VRVMQSDELESKSGSGTTLFEEPRAAVCSYCL
jgi:hypothetical protein